MSNDIMLLKKIAENVVKRVPSDEAIQMQSLWSDHTTVIYFLRRFGCPICQYLSRQFSKLKPSLDRNNVKLVGIGPEELGAKEFYEAKHFDGELFYDPDKKIYKDLQFKRYNVFNVLGGALGAKSRELANLASKEGLKGNFSGDLMQTGGLLIVKKGGGEVLLNFRQQNASDHVDNQKILDTLGIEERVDQSGESIGVSCTTDACSL